MPKGYKHLTYEDRCQIYALLKRNISVDDIAIDLGCDRSTIYRELKRNLGSRGYRYKQSHHISSERRSKASQKSNLKMTAETIELVEFMLTSYQWSPEQISGFCRAQNLGNISHETIYKHIWLQRKLGRNLHKHLRHSGKKYNKRGSKNAGRGLIPGRIDIDERPAIVELKSRTGDWEIDTIIGKNHLGAIVSLVDRKSKYTRLALVKQKTAECVTAAIQAELQDIKDKVLTLTADNGKEFAKHEEIAQMLNAEVYFAKPYQSWQRGLNEHTNGLVRQYFPKQTRFDTLTEKDVKVVENLINLRPRKILDFKMPVEVFYGAG